MEGTERKAEHVIAEHGVFAGHTGLRGLAESQTFWDEQPYGTRLYYGPGGTDYLHRGVLKAAIEALDASAASAKGDLEELKLRRFRIEELERALNEAREDNLEKK